MTINLPKVKMKYLVVPLDKLKYNFSISALKLHILARRFSSSAMKVQSLLAINRGWLNRFSITPTWELDQGPTRRPFHQDL
jgi:hypothetical protein